MLKGSKVITQRLLNLNKIHGAIAMGGGEGGVMAASAMQVLPPGFPKIIITPLASGFTTFGTFVGIRDIMVMHSLVDISGLNDISRVIFNNAAAAISGMVRNYKPITLKGKKNVGLSALGTIQKAIDVVLPKLKSAGFEPIVFHANGVGGQIMEEMIDKDYFCAVIDFSLNEITNHIAGQPALCDAGPNRLEAAGRKGIPQLIIPGCVDFFQQGSKETIPEKWHDRKMYYHNPKFTLIRPNHEEMKKIAEMFCKKLNVAKGPVKVILPLCGMSIGGVKGGSTYDPEGDQIFFNTLKKCINKDILIIEEKMHVNEEDFANRVFKEFISMLKNT